MGYKKFRGLKELFYMQSISIEKSTNGGFIVTAWESKNTVNDITFDLDEALVIAKKLLLAPDAPRDED